MPAPRAGHAKVVLNGRDLGLHVLVEGWNKQFLKRHFKNTKGNLYDGGFVQDINSALEVNSGDKPHDHAGLRALVSAVQEPDPAQRWARLERVLDMDRFLSFMAMDIIQCDWDGYAMNRNNWRIFHDLDANKMVFMPHGLDQMFGVERATPDCSIRPPMRGMVARAVMGVPEGRRQYLERLSELYTNVFHVQALLQRVDELAAVIDPVIAESGPGAARRHDREIAWLKQRLVERDESLRRQLAALTPTPETGATGATRLRGWRPRPQSGVPVLREQPGPNGKPVLYIGAANGNTTASWRTRLALEPGTYRFEGMIRTREVEPGSANGGAELRISRGPVPNGLSGSGEWRRFSYAFQVSEGGVEVEFVCELRAVRGEAWFDPSTLQVVRLQ